jgi:GNAT superfamily N-acetyltransferase
MSIEIVPTQPQHVAQLGPICFEAFRDIAESHGFPPDFPTVDVATMVVNMIAHHPAVRGFTAIDDGRVVGSNFIWFMDAVAGVGPITIDLSAQAKGIGRRLMQAVLDEAKSRGVGQVRLVQDSFNLRSLSLYASLGFNVREPLALMRPVPRNTEIAGIRPATTADLAAMDALCQRIFKISRKNEVAGEIAHGMFTPLVLDRGGTIRGYLVPGLLGHGVAESNDELLDLAAEVARRYPPPAHAVFCPLRNTEMYRSALKRGFRAIKVMQLMSIGWYDPPDGAWAPSVSF